jgi:uncharacterized membrane protein (DUF2068 family)
VSVKRGEIKSHSRWPLILIGIGKLMKAALLIVLSFYILHLQRQDVHDHWVAVLEDWRDDPHSHVLYSTLEKILTVSQVQLRALRIGVLVYAGLYGTEGVGLLFDKPWAEWMTVVTTAGFIPLEIYEIFHGPGWGKVLLLVFNIAALVYICFRLRWRSQVKHLAREAEAEKGEAGKGEVKGAAAGGVAA